MVVSYCNRTNVWGQSRHGTVIERMYMKRKLRYDSHKCVLVFVMSEYQNSE